MNVTYRKDFDNSNSCDVFIGAKVSKLKDPIEDYEPSYFVRVLDVILDKFMGFIDWFEHRTKKYKILQQQLDIYYGGKK